MLQPSQLMLSYVSPLHIYCRASDPFRLEQAEDTKMQPPLVCCLEDLALYYHCDERLGGLPCFIGLLAMQDQMFPSLVGAPEAIRSSV